MGAEPFFFSHAKEKDSKQTFARIMNVFVAVCMSAFLMVMLFLDLFKWFIPNPAFWEGLRVVPILMIANVFLGIYYNQSVWYKLSDGRAAGGTIALIGAGITWCCSSGGYRSGATWARPGPPCLLRKHGRAELRLGQKHYPVPYNVTACCSTWPGRCLLWWISTRSRSTVGRSYVVNLALFSLCRDRLESGDRRRSRRSLLPGELNINLRNTVGDVAREKLDADGQQDDAEGLAQHDQAHPSQQAFYMAQ
jgi:hypothetical protein